MRYAKQSDMMRLDVPTRINTAVIKRRIHWDDLTELCGLCDDLGRYCDAMQEAYEAALRFGDVSGGLDVKAVQNDLRDDYMWLEKYIEVVGTEIDAAEDAAMEAEWRASR